MGPALEWEVIGRTVEPDGLLVRVEWSLVDAEGERTPVLHDQLRYELGASVDTVRQGILARAVYVAARYVEGPAAPLADELDALMGRRQRIDAETIGATP